MSALQGRSQPAKTNSMSPMRVSSNPPPPIIYGGGGTNDSAFARSPLQSKTNNYQPTFNVRHDMDKFENNSRPQSYSPLRQSSRGKSGSPGRVAAALQNS